MEFAHLRQHIIKLAITGQLVEQRASEPEVEQIGPAPAEPPFELPPKWKWVLLNGLGALQTGKTPPTKHPEYFGGDIPFITPGDIDELCHIQYTNRCVTFEAKKVIKTVPAGSVLMVCIGSVGKCGLATQEVAFNQQINAITPNESIVLPNFLLIALASQIFQKQVKLKAKATTIPIVNRSEWGSLVVPIPPIEEQRRIVAVVDDLMGRLDQMEAAYSEFAGPMTEHFRNLMLQQAISGQLVPQLDSEPEVEQLGPVPDKVPFAIPAKWKWGQLNEVAEYNPNVKADDQLNVSFVPLEDLSFGFETNLSFNQIKSWEQVKKGYKRFQDGDVIFAKIHPSFQNRKSGLVTSAHNGIGCGSTEFCVYRCAAPLFNKFLLWFFKSDYFIELGKRTFKGTVGQQRVNLDVINSMYIPLPPIEEQRRIVAKLEELLARVKQLGSLEEYA